VMGGLSTALLFTAVESWMVTEHRKQGHAEELLAETFSMSATGNGLVAVFAGIFAQVLMDHLGEIGPFQAAIALTVVALVAIAATWSENYGDLEEEPEEKKKSKAAGSAPTSTLSVVLGDRKILLTGLVQSLFEGAMYTFVFNWVPTMMKIYPKGQSFSSAQGLVFSCFMLCISIGGALFPILARQARVEVFSVGVFATAALAMLVPVFTTNMPLVFGAFLVVETCVGTFFACSGTMRSMFIPENRMSSIMNIFRVPLNICVVIGTKLDNYVDSSTVFFVCFVWFGLSSLLQLQLSKEKIGKAE